MDTNALQVYRNGNRQTAGQEYVEIDPTTVTFTSGLADGDEVVFIQFGGGATSVMTAREDFDAAAGQTVFGLGFTYVPGNQEILVFSGGVLMKEGDDYLETDGNTITFVIGRSEDERISVMRIGASASVTDVVRFTWAAPAPESANAIEVDLQARGMKGNLLAAEVVVAVRVSDSPLGPPSAVATIWAKGVPLGVIIDGEGTAEVRMKTDATGRAGISVSSGPPGDRHLGLAPTFGSKALDCSAQAVLSFA